MIVLSEVGMPDGDEVRIKQPQVTAYLDSERLGDGTLCISESSVTWIETTSERGFKFTYPSIILHALSTDRSTFPFDCIYMLVDCSRAEPRKRKQFNVYTASEAQVATDLQMQVGNCDDSENVDEEDEAPSASIRFVPADTSILPQMYQQMAECQTLNPDEDDISDEDDEEIIGGASGDFNFEGENWITSENVNDYENGGIPLSEEGRANLARMLGSNHQNGHNGDEIDDNEEPMEH